MEARNPIISIVVPVYNEEAVLEIFYHRLSGVFENLPDYFCEILFVNDGSRDQTHQIVNSLRDRDSRVASINLSRNFGKEIAMTAGLDHAVGDAVVIIDADLQDPPELIPELIRAWRQGFDVVYAKRTHRDGETWLKKATAALFYRLMRRSNRVEIPADTGDFRLMSRRAVDSLLKLREHHRFMKGLFAWVGYPSTAVLYRRDSRTAGATKFNYWKLWNLALEGITSFTILPLKLAAYFGFLIGGLAFLYGGWIITKTLVWGDPVAGFPTLMVTILFLGGAQIFFIGVIGEYLGRIFNETKSRPLYLVQEHRPARRIDMPKFSVL